MTSRIEEIIDDIYEFIESCKMQLLSSTNVIVPKDELYDYLDELRLRTPDEIERYRKMLTNKDAILSDAEDKANAMLAEAQAQMDTLVEEHEIMQQAYAQADQIVQQAYAQADEIIAAAQHDAEQIRTGGIHYTADMLASLENIIDKTYQEYKHHYSGLLTSLQENLDIVRANHNELTGAGDGFVQEAEHVEPMEQQELEAPSQPEQKIIKHSGVIDDYALSDNYQ